MKTIIAVDPGQSGGIAWINANGYGVKPMPETRGDVISLLRELCAAPFNCVAYIEKISGFIPDGGASMMFVFGQNVERVGCILEVLGVRLIEVQPKAWQKFLGMGSSDRIRTPSAPRGSSPADKRKFKEDNAAEIKAAKAHNAKAKQEWKNKLKAESQRRFPGITVTLKTCDALLLLDYARLLNNVPISAAQGALL